MADSVARRPHTAMSVRGLISPPSPILVVWLPFTVFLSSLLRLHLLIPNQPILIVSFHQPVWSFTFFCLIIFIFSAVDPSATLHLLACPFFTFSLPSLPPAASTPSSSLAAHSSLERFAPASSLPPSSSLSGCFSGGTAALCLAEVRLCIWMRRYNGKHMYHILCFSKYRSHVNDGCTHFCTNKKTY